MKRIIKDSKIAAVAITAALLTACGGVTAGEVSDRAGADPSTAAAWSDQARAEQHERSARLEGQARTYRSAVEAKHLAMAEALERAAKFAAQSKTYGQHAATATSADETSNGEFLPGSRHMPTR